ncbi:hypothetical protein LB559_19865 [Mesorhizobium sp. BR1-1-3]|uniref:sulfotransferase family protein n=1 Tax=Mesorhizobium sp. BR1-1-3 TaxID=2876651 RepID=UPI001CD05E5D|nr:hypothetical protein [Mesorhizobium sp. BR1-1-3]MBZ9890185.1 hypothetical protein [Mesorhizobium sp. BR1-1-3]
MTNRTAIVVVGMHRSGTSALARVLSLLGATLPRNLNPAGLGNEIGHWEPEAAVRLNDQILDLAESPVNDVQGPAGEWLQRPEALAFVDRLADLIADEYGDDPLFVLKDPRIALLFPLWRVALGRLKIRCATVVISRNPVEVALSLAKRQGVAGDWQSWPLERGGLLWLRYNLAAEEYTRGVDRAFCDYSKLLEDWRAVVRRLGDELNIAWPKSIPDAASEIDGFLSRDRRHHQEPEDLDHRHGVWSEWIAPIFSELRGAAEGRGPDPAIFGAVKQSFGDVYTDICTGIQSPPAQQPPSGRSRLRVMRRGRGRRKICLAGGLFWKANHGDGAAMAAVEAAIADDIEISIIDIGAFTDADETAFAAFAESHSFDIEYPDEDDPPIEPSFLASTIRLLRYVRARRFDAILFQDQNGLGSASAVAKQAGLTLDGISLAVLAAGSPDWIGQKNGAPPSTLVTIGIEHLEKMAVERSTAQAIIAANSNALKGEVGRYVHSLRIALEERSRDAAEAARYASSLEGTVDQLRKANETAAEYARSLEQSRIQMETASGGDALDREVGRYVHSLQAALEARSRDAAEAARYANSLEDTVALLRKANETAAEYARDLERSRAETEEYARSLEAELEKANPTAQS